MGRSVFLARPVTLFGYLLAVAFVLGLVTAARATPVCNVPMGATDICVDFVFSFVDQISPNINGFTIGTNLAFGGEIAPNPGSVPPSPTTVTATQGATTILVPYTGNPAIPDDYFKQIPYNPSLTGPWTITITDPTGTLSVPTLAVGSTAPLPFVQSMSLGPGPSPTRPTFNWTLPSGAATNTSIFIFQDFKNGGSTLICVREGLSLTTNFTVPESSQPNCPVPAGGLLVPGNNYTVAIQLDQFTSSPRLPFQSKLVARSRSFFNFTLPSAGAPTVSLPSVGPDGVYRFNTVVKNGQTIFIDPTVAIGYDYAIGPGDPRFASVLLPTGIGNNTYGLAIFDASGNPFDTGFGLTGGIPFSFLDNGFPDGLDRFRIFGIDPFAGLDPANTTAFITGLTFTADGTFTGTMTPLTAQVPESGSFALFGSCLLGLAWFRLRRRDEAAVN